MVQSEVSVSYLAVWVGKWSKRGTVRPQWLSAHVVTVVLVSALNFCCYFHILEKSKRNKKFK